MNDVNGYANDNDSSAARELFELLEHLDRTALPLPAFGCYVAVADGDVIFVCPMLASGGPEMDAQNACMNWSQVTAPDPTFLQQVNAMFGTSFQFASFAGR